MQGRKIQLTVGGQPGEYDASMVIDAAGALSAARHFVTTGQREPTLSWKPS
jgi:hypothetical protein